MVVVSVQLSYSPRAFAQVPQSWELQEGFSVGEIARKNKGRIDAEYHDREDEAPGESNLA